MKRVIVFSLSLILLLGGVYLYQNRLNSKAEKSKEAKSIQDVLKELNKEKPDFKEGDIFNPFGASLKNLVGGNEMVSGSEESLEKNASEESPKIDENTKEAIKNYLIQSSKIKFPENQLELQTALEKAEEGNASSLIKIRDNYKTGLEEFKKLEVPEEMKQIHNESVEITEDFINLLDNTIHQTKGSVKETWDSEERENIVARSIKVKNDIIGIVNQYGIELPPEVLPY